MAQRKRVPKALNVKSWLHDFLDAVKLILSYWVISYKLLKAQLTLTYRVVTYDFREEVQQLTKAYILVGNWIVKGSFSPSFTGKEAKNANLKDA